MRVITEEQEPAPTPAADTPTPEDDAELAKQKDIKDKMKLAETTIKSLCTEDSEFADLRAIGAELKEDDNALQVKSLAGGITNYSFKASTKNTTIFAKICFEYALWNPDRSVKYDLSRVENEFNMIKDVHSTFGNPCPVVTPYHCVDITDDGGNKMKLLVTAWATTDEQYVNQFVDGDVDDRILDKLAKFLAKVICSPVTDPAFNEGCRPCMNSLYPILKMIFSRQLAEAPATTDKALEYCHTLGQEKFDKIIDNVQANYMSQLVLCHGDPNVFNVLVEPKPNVETLENFGPSGDMVIVDFEMAFVGPHGKDNGWFLGFPVAAIMAHAAHGHREQMAMKLFSQLEAFMETYEAKLRENGKDDDFVRKTYLGTLGWTGVIMTFYYFMRMHMDYLPLDDIPEEDRARMFGSIGYIGIKLNELAHGEDRQGESMTLEELKAYFTKLVTDEIYDLSAATAKRRARPRRASMLRTSERRISDSGEMELLAARLKSELLVGHLDGVAE